MDTVKVLAGLTVIGALVLTIAFMIYVFSWVFRILGFLVAALLAASIVGYCGWCWIEHVLTGSKDEGDI